MFYSIIIGVLWVCETLISLILIQRGWFTWYDLQAILNSSHLTFRISYIKAQTNHQQIKKHDLHFWLTFKFVKKIKIHKITIWEISQIHAIQISLIIIKKHSLVTSDIRKSSWAHLFVHHRISSSWKVEKSVE